MDIVSPGDSTLAVVAKIDGEPRDVSYDGNEIGLCAARRIATLVEDLNMDGYPDLYTISRDEYRRTSSTPIVGTVRAWMLHFTARITDRE